MKESEFYINDELYNELNDDSFAALENGLELLAGASTSENPSELAPCVICNLATSNDYRCRVCGQRVHHFCAVPEGKEGHGNQYLCSILCIGETEQGSRSSGVVAVEGTDAGIAVAALVADSAEMIDSANLGMY
jgi:hypothetical protein